MIKKSSANDTHTAENACKCSGKHCKCHSHDINDVASNETIGVDVMHENFEAELIKKQEEADKYKDGMLRALADFENFKKRAQKERSEIRNASIVEVVESLLPVLDNFEFGIAAAEKHGDSKIVDGFKMIFIQFKNLLTGYGLVEICPVGEKFDMRFHDCVRRVVDSDVVPDTVVAVERKGYKLNDKLLRAAVVAVSCDDKN